ncbi:MAG TPA: TonB-dependent receptor [Steroidobacteraceae bacterium]
MPALPAVATAATAIAGSLVGRRVSEVLDLLRSEGLTFIYNTQIVSDQLVIGKEPQARAGIELAKEILAANGLTVSQVAPQTFAVVAQPPASGKTAPAVAAHAPTPGSKATIEQVVVQTSRYGLAASTIGTNVYLDQEQVKNLPRLGDETLRAVQRLPGSAVNGFSSVGPVRGGVPDETAIVLDGLRLYEPFHLKNFFSPVSVLDSRIIDGMDVYSGGFPANFGDRMSAIIDTHSIHPTQERYYELGLSLFHSSALASMAFDDDRGHALLSARRSNLGEVGKLSENDFGDLQYADGFGRLDYKFTDATQGSLSALASEDRIHAIKSAGTQHSDDRYRNVYVWATLDHQWSEHANSRLIASSTSVNNERAGDVDDPDQRSALVHDARAFHVIGLRLDNEIAGALVTHHFGAEVRRLWANYDYSSDVQFDAGYPFPGSPALSQSRVAVLHPDGYESSAYWDMRFALGKRWVAQTGLRVDTQTYDGSDDSEQWSPRLSLLYNATANTRLRMSWGRFFQSQAINELQVEDGVNHFYPAQHANHLIASIEHSFGSAFDLRIEAYHKSYPRVNPHFENALDPLVLLPEAQFDRVMVDPGSSRADGVEVSLNWQPDRTWSGWISYTLSRAQDRIDGQDVYRSWDQRHALNVGVAWQQGPWAVTLADIYHTGWPTTQLQVLPPATPGGVSQVVFGPRNAERYQDYNSLDLRVTRTFTLPRGQLDVYFEASNLLWRDNPCCADYTATQNPDGSLTLNREEGNWLPLVPSVGVLWRYGK